MTRRFLFPVLLGLVGAAILCALGVWQLQRLTWKEDILADISARLNAADIPLPARPDPATDNYTSVTVTGRLTGPELHVLTTRKPEGPGFRVIRALDTGNRLVLADLGYVRESQKDAPRPEIDVTISGNLIWPDETDGFTPVPNIDRNIWFARDIDLMADALDTAPVMVAMRSSTPELPTAAMPVTVNIPNDHLQYAITWFSLMVIWLGMTAYLLWRIKRGGGSGDTQ